MTEKKIDKETELERERQLSGVLGRYSEICTFLAGIFFTCILLIVQQREKFKYGMDIAGFRIQAINMISLPLSVTFLLFVFDALIFASASQSAEHAKLFRDRAVYLFYLGLLLMLISLFSILAQISLWIAFIGIGLAIALTLYWAYGAYWGYAR